MFARVMIPLAKASPTWRRRAILASGEFAGEFQFYYLGELVGVDGFEEEGGEFLGGEATDSAADLVGGEAGEEDDGEVVAVLLEVGEDLEAVDAGHLEVEEEEVVGTGLDEEECGGAVGGLVDFVALALEELGEGGAFGGRVVAEEESGG
jgi:hypothetical protein